MTCLIVEAPVGEELRVLLDGEMYLSEIRLAILIVLEACQGADFLFLASATGVPYGNLSSHLGKLEAAGLITITKRVRRRRSCTDVSLTADGRERLRQYWACVNEARKTAKTWRVRHGQAVTSS